MQLSQGFVIMKHTVSKALRDAISQLCNHLIDEKRASVFGAGSLVRIGHRPPEPAVGGSKPASGGLGSFRGE